ncbi:MAG: hypothetical protein LBE17_14070 [Treponema sp.]|jgi:hypothetical protein|nr:hypothetical protein [Treponema sp.]
MSWKKTHRAERPQAAERQRWLRQGKAPQALNFIASILHTMWGKGFMPSIIIDKEEKQIQIFKTGIHTIAVKGADVEQIK